MTTDSFESAQSGSPPSHRDNDSDQPALAREEPRHQRPRWVLVLAILAAIAVLIVILVVVLGAGGGHGPSRHAAPGSGSLQSPERGGVLDGPSQ